MIQRFPELQGIHQGLVEDPESVIGAASLFPVQLDQAFTTDQKCGDSVASPVTLCVIEFDPGQVPAVAQEKRTTEDIRDFKDMLVHSVHLLSH